MPKKANLPRKFNPVHSFPVSYPAKQLVGEKS